jgi:DNA polymerase III delta prime subunit
MGIYRAVLVSGPPGIGKTTSAHLMAKEAGYNPIELNASDARSKKLVEVSYSLSVGPLLMVELHQYRQRFFGWLLQWNRSTGQLKLFPSRVQS